MKRQSLLLSFGFGEGSSSPVPPLDKRPAVDSGPEAEKTSEPSLTSPRRSSVSFNDLNPPYDLGQLFVIAKKLSDLER